MSSEAVGFVMDNIDDIKSPILLSLLVFARFSDGQGRGAYPSAARVAKSTNKSLRQARYDIAELVKAGELVKGDQSLVAHLRPEHRPVVYDIGRMVKLASVTPLKGRKKRQAAPAEGPCQIHAGQKAATCGPCRSERIAAG